MSNPLHLQEVKEEEEECKIFKGFKSVVVNDLKDSSNYYKFINNCKGFLDKVQKDQQFMDSEKGRKSLEQTQEKINRHLALDFGDILDELDPNRKVVILEIENTIWLVTTEQLPDCDEPLLTVMINNGSKKSKNKPEKWTYYIYVRKFGLEFIEFLCKTHEVILYTNLERELATAIIDAFQSIKRFIQFQFVIAGKPFWKTIYKQFRPVKSIDNIVGGWEYPNTYKDKFIVLDSESISYMEHYEDIFVPILPIVVSNRGQDTGILMTTNGPTRRQKLRSKKPAKRGSSLKGLSDNEDPFDIQASLNNHWLFYLKQLLGQSLGFEGTNSELLKSVSISCLALDKI